MNTKYKLVYAPEALQHIENIKAFYDKQQYGLGARFVIELKKVLVNIKKNPFVNSFRYDDIRFADTPSFPYAAHYNITDNNIIIIYVVLGFSENNSKWITK
jgi:hypothetical protein